MEQVYVKARAKINLTLEIVGKREDGYHNLRSVFQKINLYDELYIVKTNTNHLELQTNIEELNGEGNILNKAYYRLKTQYPTITGVKVILHKKIPMQAGLAGGSTDCASFLMAMNQLFQLDMSGQELEAIGKKLGADVVPCFYRQAVLAEGIGDRITPIVTNAKYYIVLIKPDLSCNTKHMYQRIDERGKIEQKNTTNQVIQALETNQVEKMVKHLYNVFESVVEEDEIEHLKHILLANGAMGSLMTGSGSCVYGIFQNKREAKQAYHKLKNQYQTYICTSYNLKKEELV